MAGKLPTMKAAEAFLKEPDMKMFRLLFSEASPVMKSCVDNALTAAFASGAAYAAKRCDEAGHNQSQH